MATIKQRTLESHPVSHSQMRKSCTKEYKLEVVRFYCENNLYQTAKRLSLNTKTIGRGVADKEKIKKASKRVNLARRCEFPEAHILY